MDALAYGEANSEGAAAYAIAAARRPYAPQVHTAAPVKPSPEIQERQ